MSSQTISWLTLEQIEEQIEHLSPPEQLKLLARISKKLSSEWPITPLTPEQEEALRQQHEREADEMMLRLEALDALMEAESDEQIVEGIHQMRRERHEELEKAISGSYD